MLTIYRFFYIKKYQNVTIYGDDILYKFSNKEMSEVKEDKRIKSYSLPIMHLVSLAAHVTSCIFAFQYNEKDDKVSFAVTEVDEKGVVSPMTGVLGKLKPMIILATCNIIVAVTMFVHLVRYLSGRASDIYKGSMAMVVSAFHIAAYALSHFLALLSVFLIAGYRDDLSLWMILAAVIVAEAVQHMMANPSSRLSAGSKRTLAVAAGAGLIIAALRIGLTLWTRDDNGMQGGIDAFVFLIAAEGLKVVNEIFTQSQKSAKPTKPDGDDEASMWAKAVDSRHVHVVMDLVIKVLLIWHLNLTNYIAEGATSVGTIDELKDQRSAVTWVTILFPGVFLVYCVAAMYKMVPPLLAGQSFEQYPSATLEEKERMLQVA